MSDGSISRDNSRNLWMVQTTENERITQNTPYLPRFSGVSNTDVTGWMDRNRDFMRHPTNALPSSSSAVRQTDDSQNRGTQFYTGGRLPQVPSAWSTIHTEIRVLPVPSFKVIPDPSQYPPGNIRAFDTIPGPSQYLQTSGAIQGHSLYRQTSDAIPGFHQYAEFTSDARYRVQGSQDCTITGSKISSGTSPSGLLKCANNKLLHLLQAETVLTTQTETPALTEPLDLTATPALTESLDLTATPAPTESLDLTATPAPTETETYTKTLEEKFEKVVQATNSFILRHNIFASLPENPPGLRNPQLFDTVKACALIRFAGVEGINIGDPAIIKKLAAYTDIPANTLHEEANQVISISKRSDNSQLWQSNQATIVSEAEDVQWQLNKPQQSWAGSTVSSTAQLNRTTAQLNLSTTQWQSSPATITRLTEDVQRQLNQKQSSSASSAAQQQLRRTTGAPFATDIEQNLKQKRKQKQKPSSSQAADSSTKQLNLITQDLDQAAMDSLNRAAKDDKNRAAEATKNRVLEALTKQEMPRYSSGSTEKTAIKQLSTKPQAEQLELLKIMVDIDDPNGKPVMTDSQITFLEGISFLNRETGKPALTGPGRNALAEMLVKGNDLLLATGIDKIDDPRCVDRLMQLIPQTRPFRRNGACLMVVDGDNKVTGIYTTFGQRVSVGEVLDGSKIAVVKRERVQQVSSDGGVVYTNQYHALWSEGQNISIAQSQTGETFFGKGIHMSTFELPTHAAFAALAFRNMGLGAVFLRRQQNPEEAAAADATAALIPIEDAAADAAKAAQIATTYSNTSQKYKTKADARQINKVASSAAAYEDALLVRIAADQIVKGGNMLGRQVRATLLRAGLQSKEYSQKKLSP
ncbi:hypothetical protein J2125_002483 [Erwinia toletana]|uniref:Uncharacterized protein n=1 Tax=Winslowiella toletana TaxID=92490 RepID=A0ABS4P9I3_9GAMM|nr:hypothetical protein [Winslowiella toletana]MBP2169291.1 hypothetical protein [Winslowiella toletana]